MAVLSIVKLYPENYNCKGSCLRMKSCDISPEELQSEWIRQLATDMFETLYSNPSGVGLAANQIAILKKICVVDIKRDASNPIVLINPIYTPRGRETHTSNEVCLSFPGVVSEVNRYDEIEVSYINFQGERITTVASGFKGNVFQHEIDHLNGIVQIDMIKDGKSPKSNEEYCKRMAKKAIENLMC